MRQSGFRALSLAICGSQFAVRDLRFSICGSRFAVRSLPFFWTPRRTIPPAPSQPRPHARATLPRLDPIPPTGAQAHPAFKFDFGVPQSRQMSVDFCAQGILENIGLTSTLTELFPN